MALFWANIAQCPVNGYSLLTHIPAVYLPTTVDDAVKQTAWAILQKEYPDVSFPPELFNMSPQHHVALVFFCNEWLRMNRPAAAADFCNTILSSKMLPELMRITAWCWRLWTPNPA